MYSISISKQEIQCEKGNLPSDCLLATKLLKLEDNLKCLIYSDSKILSCLRKSDLFMLAVFAEF